MTPNPAHRTPGWDRGGARAVPHPDNADDRTIAPDNGLNGWNMPWDEWKAGSAK